MNMQVAVGYHSSAPVPPPPPHNVHVPHTQAVGRAHNGANIEIVPQILDGHLQPRAAPPPARLCGACVTAIRLSAGHLSAGRLSGVVGVEFAVQVLHYRGQAPIAVFIRHIAPVSVFEQLGVVLRLGGPSRPPARPGAHALRRRLEIFRRVFLSASCLIFRRFAAWRPNGGRWYVTRRTERVCGWREGSGRRGGKLIIHAPNYQPARRWLARKAARPARPSRGHGLPQGRYTGGMTETDAHRIRLAQLVNQLAVVHEKVTLASGLESDFYVDMRRATLHHQAAPLIGHVMIDLLEENGYPVSEIDAVGGLTMGADPVATAMLHAANSRGLDLDAFVVRKAAKDHGMKRQIEGPDVAGKKVVVLEDTSTTGGSPLQAAEALQAAGAQVLAVAVVVDRNTGAREAITAAGYPYLYALSLDDLDI